MNRLYAPSAIPLLSSERVGIQGKVGNISVMTVAISRIDNVEYNNLLQIVFRLSLPSHSALRSRRLASPGIAALTSSSTLSRRAGRAGTRHWTRLRSPDVRRQACSHLPCSRVSAAIMPSSPQKPSSHTKLLT